MVYRYTEGKRSMSDIDDDIKATAGAIVRDAAIITSIEDEKLTLDADDPRVADLSIAAEAVATRLLQESKVERALAEQAAQPETQRPSR